MYIALALALSIAIPAAPAVADTAALTMTREAQAALDPSGALERLRAGNERFASGSALRRDLLEQVAATASGQYPFASILTCIDSRVSPELLFDQGIGDLFVARVAGNFVDDELLGSLEFASKVAGSKLILVLGHTECGAIKGACDGVELGNLTATLAELRPAVEAVPASITPRNSKNPAFVAEVTRRNVELTVAEIRERSPILAELERAGSLRIAGAIYDIATGRVAFLE